MHFFATISSAARTLRRHIAVSEPLEPRRLLASINVTTTVDELNGNTSSIAALQSSPGGLGISLREAVIACNNTPGPDQISLPGGTFQLTISGADDTGLAGDLDVKDAITISGAGSGSTIIQAGSNPTNGIDKIFSFNPLGQLTGFAVTLSGMTLRFGRNQQNFASGNGVGGAFDWDAGPAGNGSLTMSDVVCTQNSTADGDGGAVALFDGGTVNISNSQFTSNTVHYAGSAGTGGVTGGAIFIGFSTNPTDNTTITNCAFTGNSANYLLGSGPSGSGGAIFSFGGTNAHLNIHGCTISNNQAGVDGGGVASAGSTAIDQGSTLSGNSAGRWGGGFFNAGGTGTVSNCTVTGNSATGGGGQGGGGLFGNSGVLVVSNSRIVANTASSGASAADRNLANGGTVAATNNWWGTNTTPASLVASSGVSFNPWLVLGINASVTNVLAGSGATSAITAGITKNSNGAGGFSVPNGTPLTFSAVKGTVNVTNTSLTSGSASCTWTVGSSGGTGNASATVDGVQVSAAISITPLTPAAPDLQAASDSGTSSTDNLTNVANPVFDVSGVQADASVVLLRNGISVASRTGPGTLTDTAAPAGTWTYTVRQTVDSISSGDSAGLGVTIDRTAPQLLAGSPAFQFLAAPQALSYLFTEDVGASLAPGDFIVTGPSGTLPDAVKALAYNAGTKSATLTFPGEPNGILPDGNYVATVSAGSITDIAGNPLAKNVLDFFFLSGDANHDRHVDVTDLGILATNWQGTGKTFGQADFNYDGHVDVTDLGILATNWQKFVPAQASVDSQLGASASVVTHSRIRNVSRPLVQEVLS